MSNWKKAIKFLLDNEKGYSNHESDPGGPTRYGISLSFLKKSGIDINQDSYVNGKDIIHLTKSQAEKLYQTHWWDKYSYDEIPGYLIPIKIFDFSVLMGPSRAHKLFQKAINDLVSCPIEVDGIIGPITISKIREILIEGAEMCLLNQYIKQTIDFFESIVKKDTNLNVFLSGWINRAQKLP